MNSVPFTFRIDPDVKAKLETAAQSLDRTPSYVAAKAIEAFLDARAEKEAAILAAIGEADKGIFISEEQMDDWVMSWDKEAHPNPIPDITPG